MRLDVLSAMEAFSELSPFSTSKPYFPLKSDSSGILSEGGLVIGGFSVASVSHGWGGVVVPPLFPPLSSPGTGGLVVPPFPDVVVGGAKLPLPLLSPVTGGLGSSGPGPGSTEEPTSFSRPHTEQR